VPQTVRTVSAKYLAFEGASLHLCDSHTQPGRHVGPFPTLARLSVTYLPLAQSAKTIDWQPDGQGLYVTWVHEVRRCPHQSRCRKIVATDRVANENREIAKMAQ
jgi:hypothetical protein